MGIDGRLTADEAAELLGIQRRSVYHFARHLPGFPQPTHVGRTPLWERRALEEWRESHPTRKRPMGKRKTPPP